MPHTARLDPKRRAHGNTVDIPSILSHVSIGVNDLDRALAFYDVVLATVDAKRQHEVPGVAVAYGKHFPEFWVQRPLDGGTANPGNGIHFGFIAPSREAVHAFHEAALAAGARDDGAPGPRPEYGDYYGCFVYDPDGHKIEASTVPGT